MKSRKKKSLPTRAKRYKKKLSTSLDYNNLEARHLLAADAMPTINFVGTTDLVVLNDPIALNEGADLMRSQLQLGENESLKLSRVWTDQLGFEHFKYKQYFNDIVVQGSNYTLHVQDSQIVSMSGDQVAVENPIVGIQISSETALEHAKDHIGSEKYAWQDEFTSELLGLTGEPEGELVYITGDTGASIPTYKFDMYTLDLGSRDYVYVNANSGAIEATESRIRHGDVDAVGDTHYYGTVEFIADEVSDTEYRLRQVTDGVETYDNQTNPSNDFANAIDIIASAPVFDAPAQYSGVSAHWGAENTLSLFEDWFGRDSYDDEGATLVSYVNVNQNWNNATWNGSVMQYGEGDGNILRNITVRIPPSLPEGRFFVRVFADADQMHEEGNEFNNFVTSEFILDHSSINSGTLFPNPASDVIHYYYQANYPGGHVLRIFNAAGQIVGNHEIVSNTRDVYAIIDASGLPAGVYVLTQFLLNEQRSESTRFVISR